MYYYFLKRAICVLALAMCAVLSYAQGDMKLTAVHIDAGHGGHDPGAVSKDRKTYEKTLTLDISRRLASKIRERCPEVKVTMSRDKDAFVSLGGRADMANNVNANLFISIHINSAKSTSANGYSVHCLGQSSQANRDLFEFNMDICRRENSVIYMEEDYSTRYGGFEPDNPESYIFMQLLQNAHLEQSLDFAQMVSESLENGPIRRNRGISQNPFYVLWRTAMPSVLIELGFISNSEDLAALRKPEKRDEIAECLYKAFVRYKEAYDRSVSTEEIPGQARNDSEETRNDSLKQAPVIQAKDTTAVIQAKDTTAVIPGEQSETRNLQEPAVSKKYGTQIFAGSTLLLKSDPRFMGYTPLILRYEKVYRYIIGVSENEAEARKYFQSIIKKYPSAYLVEIEGDEVRKKR